MITAFDRTQGAISACVHVGFVALGGAPIVLLGLLLSCSHEDEFVDEGVCTQREWVRSSALTRGHPISTGAPPETNKWSTD